MPPPAPSVGGHLDVEHRFEIFQCLVADLIARLMQFLDDPIGDFSIFPTDLISRHARESVTVSLTGNGGDELFGGFDT